MVESDLTARIQLYLRAGQIEAAERTIHGLLQDQPNSLELLLYLADIKHIQGKFNDAIELWREVIKRNPDQRDAVYCLALCLCDVGAYQEATSIYKTYIERLEKTAQGSMFDHLIASQYIAIARLFHACGDYQRASAEIQRALHIRHLSAEAHLVLGQVYGSQEKWVEAQKEFELALKYDDRSADICSYLGLACFQNKRYQIARSYWQRALEIEPDDRIAKAYLLFAKDQI